MQRLYKSYIIWLKDLYFRFLTRIMTLIENYKIFKKRNYSNIIRILCVTLDLWYIYKVIKFNKIL